jgi:hypothetical protein
MGARFFAAPRQVTLRIAVKVADFSDRRQHHRQKIARRADMRRRVSAEYMQFYAQISWHGS